MPLLEILPLFDERTGLPLVNLLDSLYDNRELPPATLTCSLKMPVSSHCVLVDVRFSANRADDELLGLIAVFATPRSAGAPTSRAAPFRK